MQSNNNYTVSCTSFLCIIILNFFMKLVSIIIAALCLVPSFWSYLIHLCQRLGCCFICSPHQFSYFFLYKYKEIELMYANTQEVMLGYTFIVDSKLLTSRHSSRFLFNFATISLLVGLLSRLICYSLMLSM